MPPRTECATSALIYHSTPPTASRDGRRIHTFCATAPVLVPPLRPGPCLLFVASSGGLDYLVAHRGPMTMRESLLHFGDDLSFSIVEDGVPPASRPVLSVGSARRHRGLVARLVVRSPRTTEAIASLLTGGGITLSAALSRTLSRRVPAAMRWLPGRFSQLWLNL